MGSRKGQVGAGGGATGTEQATTAWILGVLLGVGGWSAARDAVDSLQGALLRSLRARWLRVGSVAERNADEARAPASGCGSVGRGATGAEARGIGQHADYGAASAGRKLLGRIVIAMAIRGGRISTDRVDAGSALEDSTYDRLHEHQGAGSRAGFPTLWGTSWDAASMYPRKPIYIQIFAAEVALTLPE